MRVYHWVLADLLRAASDFGSHQWCQGARALDRRGLATEPQDAERRFARHRPPVAWSLLGRLEWAADLVYYPEPSNVEGSWNDHIATPARIPDYLSEAVRRVAIVISLEKEYPAHPELLGCAGLPDDSWDIIVGWNDHPAMTFRSARAVLLAAAADLDRNVC